MTNQGLREKWLDEYYNMAKDIEYRPLSPNSIESLRSFISSTIAAERTALLEGIRIKNEVDSNLRMKFHDMFSLFAKKESRTKMANYWIDSFNAILSAHLTSEQEKG